MLPGFESGDFSMQIPPTQNVWPPFESDPGVPQNGVYTLASLPNLKSQPSPQSLGKAGEESENRGLPFEVFKGSYQTFEKKINRLKVYKC